MIWAAFDTETTGLLLPGAAALKDQPKIIEIASIRSDGKILELKLQPGEALSPEITKITGLKDDDLRGAPTFLQALPQIAAFFVGVEGIVAHNLPFDIGMLTTELKRCGKEFAFPYPPKQICTVAAFEHVKGRRMRLAETYQHVTGAELRQTHRALDDARALFEIATKEALFE